MKVERINESNEVEITRTDVLEFPNGGSPITLNVKYKDGKLVTSSKTNKENIPEFEIEYDKDFDFDWNLDVLYNVILKEHPEYLEMKEMKEMKESIIDKNNVEDQVMVDINKPGFLSKMEELRKNGYKRLWSGDGKVCFAKPKKMEKSIGLKEEVSNDASLVAEKMKRAFDKMNKITMDDFDEQFALAIRSILGIDNVWDMSYDDTIKTDTGAITVGDFEADVRGILSFSGYTTEFEGDNEGGLKRESLKEDYSETNIRRAVFKVHGVMEDAYTNVLANIISRALDSGIEDTYTAVVDAVDNGLIYYNDEWAVIEHYTSPKYINDNTYSEAVGNLIDDAVKVVEFIKKNDIDESIGKDIMVNQELNAPKESVESQCPAYAGAMKEMSKAQDKREKKVETDIKNVTNKDFNIEDVEKYELDESLFN